MENLSRLKEKLAEPQRIVITTHHKPDADALGSSLALYGYLRKKGHQVQVVSPTDYPRFLNWMPGQDLVWEYTNPQQQADCVAAVAQADLIFCLDFNHLGRINELGPLVAESKAEKVLIDHHLEPQDFAQYSLWTTQAAATAELIYDFIHLMSDAELLDLDMAACIYAGIMTDTGSFRHPSTTPKVLRTVANLAELGLNTSRIHSLIFDSSTFDRLRFLGYMLSQKLQVFPEYRTALVVITAQELADYKAQTGDTEGFVNFALSVEGVRFAALIVDRKEAVKMSFRSTGNFSANEFARSHFDGGGHKNAAGGKSHETLEQTVQKFLNLLPQYQNQLLAD